MDDTCINCAQWDSRDNRTGACQLLTDALKDDHGAHGVALVQTHCLGGCDNFEPSVEAQLEERSEQLHQIDLWNGAGTDYPGSLGRGPAVCRGAGA